MWDLVLLGVFWTIFLIGVLIELVSLYLDLKIMFGRGKTSGAWGVALGLFGLLLGYATVLSTRQGGGKATWTVTVVLSAIAFQIVFHGLLPLLLIWFRNKCGDT